MRLAIVCLLAAVAIFGARDAAAECARPRGELAPRDGSVLPARGVVYLNIPETPRYYKSALADAEGVLVEDSLEVRGATFEARILQEDEFSTVVRIDYRATAAQMSIRWTLDSDVEATYQISRTLAPNRATVTAVGHLDDEWACSYSDSIELTVDSNAAAYRVDWEDGTTTFLEPPRFDDQPGHRLFLGHLSCLGYNVDPERLASLRSFRLFALFPDGTEAAFPVAHAMLDDHGVRLPDELLGTTAAPLPSPLLAPAPLSHHLLGLSWLRTLLLSLSVLGVVLLILLTRRFLRRRLDLLAR